MALFRKLKRKQFSALSPEGKKSYRRAMAENDIRRHPEHYWFPDEWFVSTYGLPKSGSKRREIEKQKALISRARDGVLGNMSLERNYAGIPDNIATKPVYCSVAKSGKRWAWSLSAHNSEGILPDPPMGFAASQDDAWRDVEAAAIAYIEQCEGLVFNVRKGREQVPAVLLGYLPDSPYDAASRAKEAKKRAIRSKPAVNAPSTATTNRTTMKTAVEIGDALSGLRNQLRIIEIGLIGLGSVQEPETISALADQAAKAVDEMERIQAEYAKFAKIDKYAEWRTID